MSARNLEMVRSLLKNGANPNITDGATGWPVLRRESYNGDVEIVNGPGLDRPLGQGYVAENYSQSHESIELPIENISRTHPVP